jgi:cation transport ATPase
MTRWGTRRREPTSWAIGVILIHFAVSVLHGIAHRQLSITLSNAQALFVGVVVVALPLVAAYLLWKGDRRNGGALLAASMAGAFIFGVYFHFILPGPDHVGHPLTAGGGSDLFDETAFELATLEVLAVFLGLGLMIKSLVRSSGASSVRASKLPG